MVEPSDLVCIVGIEVRHNVAGVHGVDVQVVVVVVVIVHIVVDIEDKGEDPSSKGSKVQSLPCT